MSRERGDQERNLRDAWLKGSRVSGDTSGRLPGAAHMQSSSCQCTLEGCSGCCSDQCMCCSSHLRSISRMTGKQVANWVGMGPVSLPPAGFPPSPGVQEQASETRLPYKAARTLHCGTRQCAHIALPCARPAVDNQCNAPGSPSTSNSRRPVRGHSSLMGTSPSIE